MSTISVIKIGGNIIDHPQRLQAFLNDFAALEGGKILVHGGGKIATSIGDRLGIESQYVQGRRITDDATLEVVTMVYGGLVNKRIVASLQASGCNAIGLTGADGNVINATRRPVKEVDYGFVGDISASGVNTPFLLRLIQAGITPVFAPLTHDGKGSLLNTNADTIAQEVAKSLASIVSTKLIYCFEKSGVLRDAADEKSVISKIDAALFQQLQAEHVITDGMIPKLTNAFAALSAGVQNVIIGKAEDLPLLIEGQKGTTIS
jgi:acetylglutamate kinase